MSEATAQALAEPSAKEGLEDIHLAGKVLLEMRRKPPVRPQTILQQFGVDSVKLSELSESVPYFKEAYARAAGGFPGQKMTLRILDAFYPEWQELFFRALEEQSEAGKSPKMTVAVRALNEMEIPLKVGWVYARMGRASPIYDEDFYLAVTGLTCETLNKIREVLEEDLSQSGTPQLSMSRIAYLKTQPNSGMADMSRLTVEQKQYTIHEKRQTVTVELVNKTHELGARLEREMIDVNSSSGADDRGNGADDSRAESVQAEVEEVEEAE